MKKYRKIFGTFLILLSACCVHATPFKAGKHYVVLEKPVTTKPQLLEFFSFYCVQCYRFQHELYLSEAIKNCLPPDGQFKQYHVSGFGPLDKDLARAWAVATILGVEQKMNRILFEGIQKDDTLHSTADIRQAFIKAGVAPADYDNAINSFLVNSLIRQQKDAVREADFYGVPALLINGKYLTQPHKFSVRTNQELMHQYLQLVKQLLATINH